MKCVILAAGMATRLRPLTTKTPKCLLKIGGKALLQRSMDALIDNGCRDFLIVTGYLHEQVEEFVTGTYGDSVKVSFVYNDVYASTNNIYSLWLACREVNGESMLLLDSDLLYDPQLLKGVLGSSDENVLTLIRHELSEEEMKVVIDANGRIVEISKTCDPNVAIGESLGIEKMGCAYVACLTKELTSMMEEEGLQNVFYEKAFERLIGRGHYFKIMDVTDYYSMELDTVEDFEQAARQFVEQKEVKS